MTPTRNGSPWKYCGKCGSPMGWAGAGRGFDRTTGEEGPNFAWRCPEWEPGDRTRSHDAANATVRDIQKGAIAQ
jgi:hypothetical protein